MSSEPSRTDAGIHTTPIRAHPSICTPPTGLDWVNSGTVHTPHTIRTQLHHQTYVIGAATVGPRVPVGAVAEVAPRGHRNANAGILAGVGVALNVVHAVGATEAPSARTGPEEGAAGIPHARSPVGTRDPHAGVDGDFATLPREERGTRATKIVVVVGGPAGAIIEATTIAYIKRNSTIWPSVVCRTQTHSSPCLDRSIHVTYATIGTRLTKTVVYGWE